MLGCYAAFVLTKKLSYLLLLLPWLLTACTGELSTQGEPLRFSPQAPGPALVGEPYSQNLQVVGGLSPYSYTLVAGNLPPGLQLQGGFIRGVPTETGRFPFTIEVSDANLSLRSQEFTIDVQEPPPPNLILNAPETEVRGPFTLRVEVEEARELLALRSELRWDNSRFTLNEASIRALQNNVALFHRVEEGVLNIDMAVLGGALSGRHAVFEIGFVPALADVPLEVAVEAVTEFQTLTGAHAFSRASGGAGLGVSPDPTGDGEGGPDEETPPEDPPPDGDTGGSNGQTQP